MPSFIRLWLSQWNSEAAVYPTTMCLNQNLRMAGKGVGLGAFVLGFTYFFQRYAREGGGSGEILSYLRGGLRFHTDQTEQQTACYFLLFQLKETDQGLSKSRRILNNMAIRWVLCWETTKFLQCTNTGPQPASNILFIYLSGLQQTSWSFWPLFL